MGVSQVQVARIEKQGYDAYNSFQKAFGAAKTELFRADFSRVFDGTQSIMNKFEVDIEALGRIVESAGRDMRLLD